MTEMEVTETLNERSQFWDELCTFSPEMQAKIAEFDAVIAEADADFYAALHGDTIVADEK